MTIRPDGYVSLKAAIFDYLRTNDFVTFVELQAAFPETRGSRWMAHNSENLVVWDGLSDEAIDALDELMKEKKLSLWVVPPTVYVLNGVTLTLPIAERVDYSNQHWMPVVLHRRPPTEEEIVKLAHAMIGDINAWRRLKADLKTEEH